MVSFALHGRAAEATAPRACALGPPPASAATGWQFHSTSGGLWVELTPLGSDPQLRGWLTECPSLCPSRWPVRLTLHGFSEAPGRTEPQFPTVVTDPSLLPLLPCLLTAVSGNHFPCKQPTPRSLLQALLLGGSEVWYDTVLPKIALSDYPTSFSLIRLVGILQSNLYQEYWNARNLKEGPFSTSQHTEVMTSRSLEWSC